MRGRSLILSVETTIKTVINTTSKLQYREPDSSDFAAGDPEYEIYVNLNSL